MSNQSGVQAACRDYTGATDGDYNANWLEVFDEDEIPAGTFNERMLLWLNDRLGASYASLPQAQQAFAESQGYANWSSMSSIAISDEWTPARLSPLVWWDPSDATTLFQDTNSVTPVTADGQVVGLHLDKSGNAYHRAQSIFAKQPIFSTAGGLSWIEADGVDDCLVASNLSYGGSDKVTIVAALRSDRSSPDALFMEHSTNNNAYTGSYYLAAPEKVSTYRSTSRGTAAGATLQSATTTVPGLVVLATTHDIAGSLTRMRVNRGSWTTGAGNKGGGGFGTYNHYSYMRANSTLPFLGRDYGVIIFDRLLSDAEIALCEDWLAVRAGVTL